MAENNKVVIDIEAKGVNSVNQSLADLKRELKAAQSAALNGDGQAAKRVAELKDKLDDLKDTTKTLQGSGVEKAESSFRLLGEGLKNFDFDKIKTGFSGIGSALKAIPILLIAEGVAYLIENWKELGEGTGIVAKAIQFFNGILDEAKKGLDFITDSLGLTNSSLDKFGDTIKDNADKGKEALSGVTAEYDRQIRVAKANGKDTIELERAKQQAIIDTNVQVAKQIEAYVRAGGVLDDEKRKLLTASLEAIKNAKVTELEIEKQHKSKLLDTEKQHTKNVKEEFQKRIDENNTLSRKIEDIQISRIKNEREREETKALLDRERAIEDIEKSKAAKALKDEAILLEEEVYQEKLAEIDKKWKDKKAEEEKELEQSRAKLLKEMQDQEFAEQIAQNKLLEDELLNGDKRRADAREKDRQAEIAAWNDKLQIASNVTNSISNLAEVAFIVRNSTLKKGSEEEEKAAKRQFQIRKALQLAGAIIDGSKAITASLASAPLAIGPLPNPVGIASLVAVITNTALSIAKIASTQYKSTGGDSTTPSVSTPSIGGGSTSAPTTQTNAPTVQPFTRLNEDGTVVRNQPVVKAIVVESDITSSQKRVGKLENQATFG